MGNTVNLTLQRILTIVLPFILEYLVINPYKIIINVQQKEQATDTVL